MSKLKKLSKVLACVIILLIAICILPFKRNINTTVKGIEWKIGDDTYSKDVSIQIKGTYNQYLIKNDNFKGNISIDIYDITNNSEPLYIDFEDGKYSLIYISDDDYLSLDSFGFLVCSPDFKEILIGVMLPDESGGKGWSGENGLMITAPSKNRKEGLELAKNLSSKNDWLSLTDWN